MATLNVCARHSDGIKRFQVTVSFENSVKTLADEINKHIHLSDFGIVYCGQLLNPDSFLSAYPLQPQSTVYVIKTDHKPSSSTDDCGGPNKNEVTMAIQSALLNLEYRSIVENMLNEPDTVENIIAATPGLDKDPCVLAMLQEPELLAVMAHPSNMDSLLRLHPTFAQAAVTIATAVNEEGAKVGQKPGLANVTYSMDQMSDEEDEVPQPSRGRGNGITASQLAAAIQAATASATASQLPSSSAATASNSQTSITSDFFQQAMAHAQTASSDAALQQLRDMGISDENVARQALAATGGDIQAAIDLIFGDGFM
ncbi:ubiquitin-like protein 7 isoform X2 [Physella acuta]|uniref:ubiquitin-like protein 7 isoform X2 n=1 Tax=Physella acuta TaxID=109671 RepID=UPI0027DC3FE8|nr:ubiquitin-like protein 7 isoform X2 [Physella acuta]